MSEGWSTDIKIYVGIEISIKLSVGEFSYVVTDVNRSSVV